MYWSLLTGPLPPEYVIINDTDTNYTVLEITADVTGIQDNYTISYIDNDGIEAITNVDIQNTTDLYNLTGLKSGSTYNIYVRCSSHDVMSVPYTPVTTTTCMQSLLSDLTTYSNRQRSLIDIHMYVP